jgi:hypothetical protein
VVGEVGEEWWAWVGDGKVDVCCGDGVDALGFGSFLGVGVYGSGYLLRTVDFFVICVGLFFLGYSRWCATSQSRCHRRVIVLDLPTNSKQSQSHQLTIP